MQFRPVRSSTEAYRYLAPPDQSMEEENMQLRALVRHLKAQVQELQAMNRHYEMQIATLTGHGMGASAGPPGDEVRYQSLNMKI